MPASEKSSASRSDIGRRSKQRGAAEEREVARLLTEQTGEEFKRVGNRGASSADVESDEWVIEIKSRQSAPFALLTQAESQMRKAMSETGKDGLIVLSFKENGKRKRYVVKPID